MDFVAEIVRGIIRAGLRAVLILLFLIATSVPILLIGDAAQTAFSLSQVEKTWLMCGMYFVLIALVAWIFSFIDARWQISFKENAMRILRYISLALTSFALLIIAYLFISKGPPRKDEIWIIIAFAIPLLLNLYYLLFSVQLLKEGRVRKLIALWFEVKEAELRKRARIAGEPE